MRGHFHEDCWSHSRASLHSFLERGVRRIEREKERRRIAVNRVWTALLEGQLTRNRALLDAGLCMQYVTVYNV